MNALAYFLLGMMSLVWFAKGTHELWHHHGVEKHSTFCDKNAPHLHESTDNNEDCFICHFQFSPIQVFDYQYNTNIVLFDTDFIQTFVYSKLSHRHQTTPSSRGPPAHAF